MKKQNFLKGIFSLMLGTAVLFAWVSVNQVDASSKLKKVEGHKKAGQTSSQSKKSAGRRKSEQQKMYGMP